MISWMMLCRMWMFVCVALVSSRDVRSRSYMDHALQDVVEYDKMATSYERTANNGNPYENNANGYESHYPRECPVKFQVWQADDNILWRITEIEDKFRNASSKVDKDILALKNYVLEEVLADKTSQVNIDSKLMEFKNHDVKMDLSLRDLRIEFLEMKRESDKMAILLSQLRREAYSNNGVTSGYYRQVLVPASQDHAPSTKSELKYIQADLIQYKSNLSDLKAEWLLIRREMTGASLDMRALEQTQADMKTDLNSLKSRIDAVAKEVDRFRDEQLELLRSVQTYLSTGNIVISGGNLGANDQHTDVVQNLEASISTSLLATDCHEVYRQGHHVSGVYRVQPLDSTTPESVYCDMFNGTGWTVVQRRVDGSLNFNRGWLEYQYGFGNLYGEFWIGNEFLHRLTKQREYLLRVEVESWEGNRSIATYDYFHVGGREENFKLQVTSYKGQAGDSLSYHDGMAFSTSDNDNDQDDRNCAADHSGGWWFNKCFSSNLNGVYRKGWYMGGNPGAFPDGIAWYTLKESEYYSLKRVEMKVKPYYL